MGAKFTGTIKKEKTFPLKSFGKKFGEIQELGNVIIEEIGDQIFYFQNMTMLLYSVLNRIYPINKTLKPNDISIELGCEKIVSYFGLDKEASISIITEEGSKKIEREKKSSTDLFCEWILGLDKLPSHFYRLLSNQVNNDLISITELITWYESHLCVQKYIVDDEVSRIHEDRVMIDFYKRCVYERVNIFNYQLFGLKKQALSKARRTNFLQDIFSLHDLFNDRPYHYARFFSIHYFDCRKIDLSGHRVGELPIQEGRKMQIIYAENKPKFYRNYFKRLSIQEHFNQINFYMSYLPLDKDRKLIFDELTKLFKAKRWMSFYALALPQVEGLFSEMCLVVLPEKDFSRKSLTDKVHSVRPYHSLSNSYFDYYQYHIPLQRNKFAHTGFDEDFKLKSYDLLVDLLHLMRIFYELDNPLIKIKKIHTRKNFEDFISLSDFIEYFTLLKDLKPKQRAKIKSDILDFERDFLWVECGLEYICYEVLQEFPKLLSQYTESIKITVGAEDIYKSFESIKASEMDKWINENQSLEIFKQHYHYNDFVQKLYLNINFITNYKLNLPSMPIHLLPNFDTIKKENSEIISKLGKLETHLKT